MAAFVAAALAGVGDAVPRLAAILSDRYRRPLLVVAMAALALLAASGVAAAAGGLLAPRLTPEAKQLFLAMALLLQGGGALFAGKPPDRLEGWRIGAAATSAAGLFILAFGDGVQFIVLALAARSAMPWLAAIGAGAGGLAVVAAAVTLGEADWLRLPLSAMRRGSAILFLLAGAWLALDALALI